MKVSPKIKISKEFRDLELEKLYREQRQEQIYEQVKLRSRFKKVNAMLRALKKEGYYDETVAVENIMNYLGSQAVDVGKTKAGYVSLKGISGKTQTQFTAINKAINEFMKNRTSTVKGFEALYSERRQELLNMFDDEDFINNLSDKDIRRIYSVFQSNEYQRNDKKFDSKTFFTLYTQAIDKKYDRARFIKEVNYYIDSGTDMDLKEDIVSIYDQYIKQYIKR